MPTDADWQAQIVREVGDSNSLVATNIAAMWALYADKAFIAPRLQYVYVKRAALETLWGSVRDQVTTEAFGDVKINLTDKVKSLAGMIALTNIEIGIIERRARGNRTPAVGPITAVEPILPPSLRPIVATPLEADANDERYEGSPYRRAGSPYQP